MIKNINSAYNFNDSCGYQPIYLNKKSKILSLTKLSQKVTITSINKL